MTEVEEATEVAAAMAEEAMVAEWVVVATAAVMAAERTAAVMAEECAAVALAEVSTEQVPAVVAVSMEQVPAVAAVSMEQARVAGAVLAAATMVDSTRRSWGARIPDRWVPRRRERPDAQFPGLAECLEIRWEDAPASLAARLAEEAIQVTDRAPARAAGKLVPQAETLPHELLANTKQVGMGLLPAR